MPEVLYVVVQTTQEAQPEGRYNHQNKIDIAQTSKKQYRDEQCNDDNDAAHGGHSNLIDTERVYFCITLGLRNLLFFQQLDELLTEPCRDDEGQDHGKDGAERYVAPHVGTADTELVEPSEDIV